MRWCGSDVLLVVLFVGTSTGRQETLASSSSSWSSSLNNNRHSQHDTRSMLLTTVRTVHHTTDNTTWYRTRYRYDGPQGTDGFYFDDKEAKFLKISITSYTNLRIADAYDMYYYSTISESIIAAHSILFDLD